MKIQWLLPAIAALAVTACGRGVEEACGRAYRGVAHIHFDGSQHRTDIGRA